MLAQGITPQLVIETLGHADIGTTMNIYAHLIPAMRREAIDKMNALFRKTTGSGNG